MRRMLATPILFALFSLAGPQSAQPQIPDVTDPAMQVPDEVIYPRVGEIAPLADSWRTVSVEASFDDPVVIAGPPTHTGPNPGVLQVRNVSGSSFEARFREWRYRRTQHDDTRHDDESAFYLMIEKGPHSMVDESQWRAGTFDLDGTEDWHSVEFEEAFPGQPRLFLTSQTANGAQPFTVRAREVGPGGFEAAIFEEEALSDGHVDETVGYLAVYSDSEYGTANVNGAGPDYEVDYRLTSETLTDEWKRVGPVSLHIEEESSADDETDHVEDRVDVLILGPPATDRLFAQLVTDRGTDPAALRMAGADRARESSGAAESPGSPEQPPTGPRTAVIGLASLDLAQPLENNGDDPAVVTVAYRGRLGEGGRFYQTPETTPNLGRSAQTHIYRVAGDAPGETEPDTYVQAELQPFELFGVCFVLFERDNSDWDDVVGGVHAAVQDARRKLNAELGAAGRPDFEDTSDQNARFIARSTLNAAQTALDSFKPWEYRSHWNRALKDTDDFMGVGCAHTVNVPGLAQSEIEALDDFVFHGTREGEVVGSKFVVPIYRGDPREPLASGGRWVVTGEVHLGLEDWREAGYPFEATY